MQLEERKARMLSLGGAEEVYRRLYLSHPELYFYDQRGELFADWEGFCALYRRYAPDAALPDESPTLMNHILLEQNFFEGAGRDACVVINARYCPPFWHHLNFIKIMYVLNGEILINFGRENHMILRKGSFIISPPNIKQSVFFLPRRRHRHQCLSARDHLRAGFLFPAPGVQRAFAFLLEGALWPG